MTLTRAQHGPEVSESMESTIERADLVLEMYKQDTVTTFGIGRTEKPRSAPIVGKENINQDAQQKDSVEKPKV